MVDEEKRGAVCAEEQASEATQAESGEPAQAENTVGGERTFKITLEDRRDGTKTVVETDYAFLMTHVDDSEEGDEEKCLMHVYEWCNASNRVRISAGKALERSAEKVREKLLSDLMKNYFSEGDE